MYRKKTAPGPFNRSLTVKSRWGFFQGFAFFGGAHIFHFRQLGLEKDGKRKLFVLIEQYSGTSLKGGRGRLLMKVAATIEVGLYVQDGWLACYPKKLGEGGI